MLHVSHAKKVFFANTPDERTALDDVSLDLRAGEFCVVIGTNGAGKSSLLNAISGKLSLDRGTVAINGENVTALPPVRRSRWIARVFQDPMVGTAPAMTIAENMLLAELRGGRHRLRSGVDDARRGRYRDCLAVLGLGLEDRLDTKVSLLSGGQRQSLSLLMAVSSEPALLLLDEHTAALDPRTAGIVMQATVNAIEAFGLTALMVTHNMEHAITFGSRIIMLDRGRIVLDLDGDHKSSLTVASLVEEFHVANDRMLLG